MRWTLSGEGAYDPTLTEELDVYKLEKMRPWFITARFETAGVVNYIPGALLPAQILLCGFAGNVAHILRGQKVKFRLLK
jgi:hypothetical protein